MYKTTDGEIFETRKDADDHESTLQDKIEIGRFLDETKPGAKPAVRTRALNNIMEYLDWKNRDIVVPVEKVA